MHHQQQPSTPARQPPQQQHHHHDASHVQPTAPPSGYPQVGTSHSSQQDRQAPHSQLGAAQAPQGGAAQASQGGGATLVRHYANAGMVHQQDQLRRDAPANQQGHRGPPGGNGGGGASARAPPSAPVPFLPGFQGGDKESFGINAVSRRGRPDVTPGTLPSAHDKHARGWIRYHLPEEHRPGIRPTNASLELQRTTAGTMAVFGGATSPEQRPGTAPVGGGRGAPNPGRRLQSSEQTATALAWGDDPSQGAPREALHDDIGTAVRPRRTYVHKNLTSSHVADSLRYDSSHPQQGGEGGVDADGYDPAHAVRPRTAFVARTQRSDGVQSALTGRGDGGAAGAFDGYAPVTATAEQVRNMGGRHGKRIQHYEKAQRSAEGILQRDGQRYFESTHHAMHTGASEGGPRARTPPKRGKRPVTQGVNNPYRQTWVFG